MTHPGIWAGSGYKSIFFPLSHELPIIIITLLVGVWSVNGPSSLYYLLKAQQMIMLEKKDFGCNRSWGRLDVMANSLKGCWRQLLVEKIMSQLIDNSSGVHPWSQRGNCMQSCDRLRRNTDLWTTFERNRTFFSFHRSIRILSSAHEMREKQNILCIYSIFVRCK